MLCGMCRKFLNDELGGGTIFGLLWFMLLVGITGMAVDSTNGFRNRTMLQATADAAALAGAISLTNEAAAVATAVSYSVDNMSGAHYGDVLNGTRHGAFSGNRNSIAMAKRLAPRQEGDGE